MKLDFLELPDIEQRVHMQQAAIFPLAFQDWQCKVIALEIERSFWEKATILHAEYHRLPDKPMPNRFSRHYADTAALLNHPVAINAINQHDPNNLGSMRKVRLPL